MAFKTVAPEARSGSARDTIWHKILTGENIDEFDEFPTIRQYFPYKNFTFSHLPIMNLW